MAARLLPEAFATLSLAGRSVAAEDVLNEAICARRLKESLDALIGALQEA
jgi:hypothetical protein